MTNSNAEKKMDKRKEANLVVSEKRKETARNIWFYK